MRQVGLIPSGAQKWHSSVLTITEDRILYCSTLSVYVFNLNTYQLERILTGHLSSITSLIVNPHDKDMIATSSSDQTIRIWDLKEGALIKLLPTTGGNLGFKPLFLDWSKFDRFELMCCGRKTVRIYNYRTSGFKEINLKTDRIVRRALFNNRNQNKGICICSDYSVIEFDIAKKVAIKKHKTQFVVQENPIPSNLRILDFQLDPLSENYFICVFSNGEISLFDMNASSSEYFRVKTFNKFKVSTISWIQNEPGNFLTGDTRSGIIRMWNVSQNNPKKILKLRKSGIRKIMFSGSNGDKLAVSFLDGAVGVYNYKQEKFEFLTEPGHIETIFGCSYSKSNPDIFATSSYDSKVKLWNTRTMKCIGDLVGIPSNTIDSTIIIYSISFHPTKNFLAGSLGNGQIWIWDTDKFYPVSKHKLHKEAVYRVAWNQLDENLLASSSKDKTCVVFKEDGKVVKKYKHPNTIFGVDWSPFDKNILVTGCHDKSIRVFDISKKDDAPIKRLVGHRAQVYNVLFHPIIPDVICSGSNDYTVRVWNIKTGKSKVMKGHTNNVRALSWNHEIPHICISGSWDGTIRVWDTRTCKCLYTVTDHHADVYGISSHPERPFSYGSTSRDTTIRFWSLESLFEKAYIQSVVNLSMSGLTPSSPVTTDNVFLDQKEKNASVLLCGNVSQRINNVLKSTSTADLEKFVSLLDFLHFPFGSKDVLLLLKSIIMKKNCSEDDSFIHEEYLLDSMNTKSQDLILEKTEVSGIGSKSVSEIMEELKSVYLAAGKIKEYCEVLVELGKWEKALSIAPAEGLMYWKSLAQRYSDFLLNAKGGSNETLLPYIIGSKEIDDVISFLVERKEFSLATSLVVNVKSKKFESLLKEEQKKTNKFNVSQKLKRIIVKQGDQMMQKSLPYHSTCCYLRINQFAQAIRSLERGNQLLHAFSLLKLLDRQEEQDKILFKLSKLTSKHELVDETIALLAKINDQNLKIQFVCQITPKSSNSEEELNKIYMKSGLQDIAFYKKEAKRIQNDPIQIIEAIKFFALAREFDEAAELAVHKFKQLFGEEKEDGWKWKQIIAVKDAVGCIQIKNVTTEKLRFELLGYINFIAAQEGLWKGFYPIVPFLISNSRLMFKNSVWGIPKDYLDYFFCLAFSFTDKNESMNYVDQVLKTGGLSKPIELALQELKQNIKENGIKKVQKKKGKNIYVPMGSNLPTRKFDGTRVKSLIDGKDCEAPIVSLSPTKFMSLADALMWIEVNPFTPLNTGEHLEI